jgi:hypothetical protein
MKRNARSVVILWSCLLLSLAPAVALEPLADRTPTVWLGPEPLDPEQSRIGTPIEDFRFRRILGGWTTLHAEGGKLGTVVVVRDPECPVSRRYGPRIKALARTYGRRGIRFVVIYLNDLIGPMALAKDARALAAPASYAGEGSFKIAAALGVASTGDVFLLDGDYRLRYRGAIDDQYGLGYTKDAPTRYYLRNALDALIEGRTIAVPATTAPGCWIDADPSKDPGLRPVLRPGEIVSWAQPADTSRQAPASRSTR